MLVFVNGVPLGRFGFYNQGTNVKEPMCGSPLLVWCLVFSTLGLVKSPSPAAVVPWLDVSVRLGVPGRMFARFMKGLRC